ncbi:TlpA disulfide reductase family protein [Corynebacterium otitidis]|uniref:TlpA disulfide reductase family protein n=1 Tax=Corynebacterium otitidis TaxID=29321 RepID=UPI000627E6FF|nr:TlpA disulfide reductase family protein [Corynebacterium otitidis]KKO83044.1 effector protein [Corynebacterium otitidis]
MRLRITRAACATLASAALLAGCGAGEEQQHNAVAQGGTFQFHSPGGQLEIFYPEEERAPIGELEGESLTEDGERLKLSDFDGQVVVLNVWGQWCAPCRTEVDDLQRVHDEISDKGGTVLGINVRDHNKQLAQDFAADNWVDYPSIYDPPFRNAAALGGVPTSVVPTTIVLDKQHRPAAVFLREITDEDVLKVTDELLGES